MLELAAGMARLGTETAFEVLARAAELQAGGRDIINLGIGQPDFRTPDHIVEAAVKALRDGHHGYTPAQGIVPSARGGGGGPAREARRRGQPGQHRHHAGRQADHVLRHPDVRPAGRRDHVSGPRLSDLSIDDRVHRRDPRPDRAARGERLRLLGGRGAGRHNRADAADHRQLARQPDRRRDAARRGRAAGRRAWRITRRSR